jgi:hypothetical protein
LYISPAPSSDYSYELIYHVLYFPLGDSNQSNFLTEKYSDVLMDCCLYFFYKQVQMNLSFAEFYKNEVLAGVQDIISNDQMNKTDRQSNTEIS